MARRLQHMFQGTYTTLSEDQGHIYLKYVLQLETQTFFYIYWPLVFIFDTIVPYPHGV